MSNPLKLDKSREQIKYETDRVSEHWARTFGAVLRPIDENTTEGEFTRDDEGFPDRQKVRDMLWFLPLEDLIDAVDASANRIERATESAVRYFYGVCWRKRRTRAAEMTEAGRG